MEEQTDTEEMRTADSGQGIGFAGNLYVVWGSLTFPMHGAIVTCDEVEGKLTVCFNANKDTALSLDLMQNENVQKLVADQQEGENMTRSVVQSARDMLYANLMNNTVLIVDLGAALDGMGRRADANG